MKIQTEQAMREFCDRIKTPVDIQVNCNLTLQQIALCRMKNAEMVQKGILRSFEVEQGIGDIDYDPTKGLVLIKEVPYLFPVPAVLEQCPGHTGPLTGVLVNEYDPTNQRHLFHLRGKKL